MPRVTFRNRLDLAEYRTFFLLTENPISEGGQWINGETHGTDWEDMQSTPGKAFGTQSGSIPPYDDSVCFLTGSWPANLDIQARVFITSRSGWDGYHEVELHGRATMTAGFLTTYEVIFSTTAGTTYCEIVRWKGPVGQSHDDFDFLITNSAFAQLNDGDYIRATFIGYVITGYTKRGADTSWTQEVQYDASSDVVKLATGAPGYGHWKNGNGAVSTYGISEFSVTAV